MKHPQKVMIWGIMSVHGAGRLHVCEGSMNKEQYLRILETRVMAHMQENHGDNGVYMHDSAPCHTAKLCTKFLSDNNISILKWPGNSPDLNPIETLWAIIKDRLSKLENNTRNMLISNIIKVWHRDASLPETCRKLIHSMPSRIKAVISAKGGNTNY